ncbi:peptidoglycan-binding protein [Streptomyces sp. ID05-04B]|uniref:peptidoglycan-binding domain-containing protein n=1 Tax=Streptomyces sp. ID05-04B TaxID=3028661 RepID=UPI0029C46116|nr:peptidoglycan-binding protein [Streptomyces sp. ID05-04B]MDX5569125.1 peptidoglycan-binding protein [Streptomyces sp. ID05-04B]
MSEPQRGVCPLCGAPRAADAAPTCVCARLASDAHRSARTAEAAGAEDFDPVRIRPFVTFDAGRDQQDDGGRDPQDDALPESSAATGPAPAREHGEPPSAKGAEAAQEGDGMDGFAQGDSASGEPESREAGLLEPESGGAELRETGLLERVSGGRTSGEYERADDSAAGPGGDDTSPPGRRRSPLRLLVLAGLLATAVTAAVLAGFLLYDGPTRDGALPGGVRAPVPDVTSAGVTTAGKATPRASRTPPSPTASDSPETPSSPTAARPTRSAAPPPAPSRGATGTTTPGPGPSASAAPVLRFGDTGPEVAELQARLRQIGYQGGRAEGVYDVEVENAVRSYQLTRAVLQDEPGVYGVATRASLEAETDEP